ncbi:hypothetical protein, partial [Acinetobacter indicus]|uniref:hypothetical protein n=1 Tax=Acinetobacter indicus TaxID=756892 RepID=UPI001BB46F46
EVFVRRLRVLKPFFAVPMKRQKRCVQLRLHYGNSVALAPSSSLSRFDIISSSRVETFKNIKREMKDI